MVYRESRKYWVFQFDTPQFLRKKKFTKVSISKAIFSEESIEYINAMGILKYLESVYNVEYNWGNFFRFA